MKATKFLTFSLFIASIPFLYFFFTACSGENRASDVLPASALDQLNTTITNSGIYKKQKETQLDSIKHLATLGSSPYERWQAYVNISKGYRQTEADSAIVYAAKALDLTSSLPDSVSPLRGELAFVDALATAGIFPPALHKLDSLGAVITDTEDKINYWYTARRCYSYIMTWVENHDYYVNTYRKKYNACDDSLLRYLPPFRQILSVYLW